MKSRESTQLRIIKREKEEKVLITIKTSIMTKELKFVGDVREEDEEHRGADFLRRVVQREFQEQRSD